MMQCACCGTLNSHLHHLSCESVDLMQGKNACLFYPVLSSCKLDFLVCLVEGTGKGWGDARANDVVPIAFGRK